MLQFIVREKFLNRNIKTGIPQYAVREIGKSDITGTTIHFWPDDTIFIATVYKKDILEGRLRELSFLNRGITYYSE